MLHVVTITRICLINNLNSLNGWTDSSFVKSLENIYSGIFTTPENVRTPSDEYINLGLIFINIRNSSNSAFSGNAIRELNSILTYSSGTPLHIIVLTNRDSVRIASRLIGHVLARRVSEMVILRKSWRWSRLRGLPVIKTSYVDVEDVVKKHQPFVNVLKKYSSGMDDTKNKYANDLFYIAPLYHLTFPNLDKVIMIDFSDLIFQDDIKLLNDQFAKMEGKLIGMIRIIVE